MCFSCQKSGFTELHRRNRLKKESTLISKLLFKRPFLLRKAKAFYRVGIRLMKPYLLCHPNHPMKQKGLIHKHHAAVIAM